MLKPTRVYPVVALVSIVAVEFGGWSLLGVLTGSGQLTEFEERWFRAGHAHAGTLLILALVYDLYLARATMSERAQWTAGGLLMGGILAQSGGFFLHMLAGEEGASSAGTWTTRAGGLAIAAAIVMLVVGLVRKPRIGEPTPEAQLASVGPEA